MRDFAPAALEPLEPTPNFALLSEEEKAKLRLEAAAKVEARERDRAMQAFLEAEIERLEREAHPEAYEEEKEIVIDAAIYVDRLIIDGKHYMHGRRYTVKKSLYDVMADIVSRTHRHYADTHKDPAQAMMEAAQSAARGSSKPGTVISGRGLAF